jgi:hypothetical protein
LVCILSKENLSPKTWSKTLFPMLFIQFLNKKKRCLMMRQPQTNLSWMNKNRFHWQLRPTMLWNNNQGPFISSLTRKRSPSKMKRS